MTVNIALWVCRSPWCYMLLPENRVASGDLQRHQQAVLPKRCLCDLGNYEKEVERASLCGSLRCPYVQRICLQPIHQDPPGTQPVQDGVLQQVIRQPLPDHPDGA